MLAHALAFVVALGSFTLYMSAFFLPEVYRKRDFIWSGVGMFYALVLWVYAGRITGGVLLGQVASVTLLGWLGWQTLQMRRSLTPYEQQTWLPGNARTAGDVVRQVSQKLPASLRNLFQSSEPALSPQPQIPTATVERQPKPRTRSSRRKASPPAESPAVEQKSVAETVVAPDVQTSRISEVVVPEVVEAVSPVTPIAAVQPPVAAENTAENLDAETPDQPSKVPSVETPVAEGDFGFTEEESSAVATASAPETLQEDAGGFFSNLRRGFKPKKAPRPPIEVVAQRPERFGEPKVPRSGRTPIQVVARRPERFGGPQEAPQEDPQKATSPEPVATPATVTPVEPPTVQPIAQVDEWDMDWDEPAVTVTETAVEAVSVTDVETVEVIEVEVAEVFVEAETGAAIAVEPIEPGNTEDAPTEAAIAVEPIEPVAIFEETAVGELAEPEKVIDVEAMEPLEADDELTTPGASQGIEAAISEAALGAAAATPDTEATPDTVEPVAIDVETLFVEGESEEPLGTQEPGLAENPFDSALEGSEGLASASVEVEVEVSVIEDSSAIDSTDEVEATFSEEEPPLEIVEIQPDDADSTVEAEAIAEPSEPNEISAEESPVTGATPVETEVDWEEAAIAEVNDTDAEVHTVEESVEADHVPFEPTVEPSTVTAPFLEESITPFSFELPDAPPPPPVEPLTLEFSDVPPAPIEAMPPSHDIVSELEDLFDAPLNTVFSESNVSQDAGKQESI